MEAKSEVEVEFVTVSFVTKRLPAVSAVVDAYGNCEACVDEEKNAPADDQMEVEVAAVGVFQVEEKSNGERPFR